MGYIKREIEKELLNLFASYPVVTITGPRQAGKTTLAKHTFPELPYVNLEKPDDRQFAIEDPNGFITKYSDGAVIDEFQNSQNLASYLQAHIDKVNKNSLYILTGSEQLQISNRVSQSLAGRTGILRLLPFTISEASSLIDIKDPDYLLYSGFYPRILTQKINPTSGYQDYLENYIERDLRQLSELKNLSLFKTFLKLCSGRIGQLLNLHNMTSDIGVSHNTLRQWLSLLETLYIVFLVPPFHAQLSKRLVRTPKLYFYDVGLALSLLGIKDPTHFNTHPLRGNLFENLVVAEAKKHLYNQGRRDDIYFYRDSSGREIDLLYPVKSNFAAIEIKASATFNYDFAKNLEYFENLKACKVAKKIVVYSGQENFVTKDISVENYTRFVGGL